jgi:hypothetical protein
MAVWQVIVATAGAGMVGALGVAVFGDKLSEQRRRIASRFSRFGYASSSGSSWLAGRRGR